MIEIDEISENPCIKTFRNVVERLDKLTTIEMGKKEGMYEWMKAFSIMIKDNSCVDIS